MDQLDVEILKLLQLDGRMTISELSKKLALSRPSISERLKRLQEQGVIEGFTALVSPSALGKELLIMIELSGLRVSQYEFEEFIKEEPNILECHRATGHVHYYIKAALRGTEELTRLIENLIPYGSTQTSILLATPVVKRVVLPNM
ncbi:Lrp/AsnC family transcriptional regulator [Ralstonia pickettii]|nr:Lrp/AsnC family transcriptional regulator [Ralstonia pickettii]